MTRASSLELRFGVLGALFSIAIVVTASAAQASVIITARPTRNMVCSAGVCSPTKATAWLNATELANLLASSNVTVNSGSKALDIEINAPFNWTSGNRLTLDSFRSVTFQKPVTVAGPGGLTLKTNDGGSGGVLQFLNYGSVRFWDLSSSLVIDGLSYTLVSSVSQLAADVAAHLGGRFAFANNYDAKKDGVYSASPVPRFGGKFQGLGNRISNLQINATCCMDPVYVGLFGRGGGAGATYSNLRLNNVSVRSSIRSIYTVSVGALVGSDTSGQIFNVTVSGSVSVQSGGDLGSSVGGIAGSIGKISDSSSSAAVNISPQGNGQLAGGLVAGSPSVLRSHASGAVTCDTGTGTDNSCEIGGLMSFLDAASGIVQDSDATGPVTVTGNGSSLAGGLLAEITGYGGALINSHATGNVSIQNSGS